MTDDELRALIRQAVSRHLGAHAPVPVGSDPAASPVARSLPPAGFTHPSHYQYLTLVNVGDSCVIEPAVKCNHCGYCKSHGY